MVKHLWLAGFALLSVGLNAQVGINAGQGTNLHPKIAKDAVLQVANKENEHKGVLFPQLTTEERNSIANPSEGLMIYNTTLRCLQVYNGIYWSCSDGKNIDVNYTGSEYVKDRYFGDGKHDFIYKVVIGPDGKKWLNNNLGADYANIHSSVFNPDIQAQSKDDFHAYGSLLQWGRDTDGYELVKWTSSTTGMLVNPKDGVSGADLGDNPTWNPCPSGYRLPSYEEFVELKKTLGKDPKMKSLFDSTLKFSAAGFRDHTGIINDNEDTINGSTMYGVYWGAQKSGDPEAHTGGYYSDQTKHLSAILIASIDTKDPNNPDKIIPGEINITYENHAYAPSVRCIQN